MGGHAVIQPVHLTDQVYDFLRSRLLKRELGPGTKLSLQSLADEFAVSRSPVHHALTRLVAEGLVDTDRRGYSVRALTGPLLAEAHDVRCALELFAAERTMGRLSAAQLGQLRALIERTVEFVTDSTFVDKHEYMQANKELHEYLVDLADNSRLSQTYRALSLHELMETVLAGAKNAAGTSTEDHRRIGEAYQAGDLGAARAAIIANVETGKRLALDALDAAGGVL